MIELSVTVPTFNRAAFLEPCLVSLCEQTIDPSRYEICVVNNACTDATPEIVAKVAARYPNHRLFMVYEPVAGLSRARNCGLRSTAGALIASMDDDGTVYPNWLERFIGWYAQLPPDLAIVSGEIDPVWESPRPDWLTDALLSSLSARTKLGTEARYLRDKEWGMEGNSCYRRSFLDQAGPFPEELGRIGACLLSGEGVIENRIRALGGRMFFDPQIILRHFIHANRLHPMWFRHRYFWQGISDIAVRRYKERHGLQDENKCVQLALPLDPKDWAFVAQDTAENLEANLWRFQSLGFVLALAGIIPIEN